MALTQGHHLFASIDERAFNLFITAFRSARPKYFYYACPPLGQGIAGVDFYVIPPLPIPGTSSGLPISIRILDTNLDLTPAQPGLMLPPPLNLGDNQFAFSLDLEVCFLCGVLKEVPKPSDNHDRVNPRERRPEPQRQEKRIRAQCAKLSVWALGQPTVTPNAQGGRDVGLHLDRIVVKDVGALEALLECYSETMLNTLLANLRYSVEQHALGVFGSLSLTDGPQLADNQLKVWADIN